MTDQTPQKLDCQAQIPPKLGGERVDKAAALLLPEFSRAELTRWIGEGALTLDGGVVKPKYKVFGGELLELKCQRQAREDWQSAEAMNLDILFEDEDLLVINKPAGLVVHPGAGNSDGTLVNGLLHHRPQLQELPRAGVVHRLDKETSGIMVVAGSPSAYRRLVEAISVRQVRRRYVAVCEGVMVSGQDIDRPIGRDPKQRTRQVVREDGKSAQSLVRVRARYRAHSAVDVTLGSGRTHQIRVHMQSIGHPLVGDTKYGCRRILPRGADADTVTTLQQFPRQALHAFKLDFAHPTSEHALHFAAPIPEDLGMLMQTLAEDAQ
ncbi:MAG: RluA family pseudouridine synthase [Pseudomonadales bacterium]|nr:RluA family pseudouridine synthase [Pseudomonadales bacterium]